MNLAEKLRKITDSKNNDSLDKEAKVIYAAIAGWMALVNLINLLPVNPLDGGQLIRTITFSVNHILGIVFLGLSLLVGVVFAIKFKVGLFAFLLFAAMLDFVGEIVNRKLNAARRARLESYLQNPDNETWVKRELDKIEEIPGMTTKQMLVAGGSYVGLVLGLLCLVFMTAHIPGADITLKLLQE